MMQYAKHHDRQSSSFSKEDIFLSFHSETPEAGAFLAPEPTFEQTCQKYKHYVMLHTEFQDFRPCGVKL